MATINKPYTFTAGNKIIASEHNSNFDTIYNDYNGNITNDNVNASAAIVASKLNLTSITQTMVFNNNGNAIPTTIINAGTESGLYVNQSGVLASSKYGIYLYSNAIQVNSPLVYLHQDHASSTQPVLSIKNDGSGAGIVNEGDLYNVAWTDYSATSTIVGWASFINKQIYYKKIGRLVFVCFSIKGASNSTSCSFSTPFTSTAALSSTSFVIGQSIDNDNLLTTAGNGSVLPNDSSVILYKDAGQGAWTNSLTKQVIGQFWYEAAT